MNPDDAQAELKINEFFKKHENLAKIFRYEVIE